MKDSPTLEHRSVMVGVVAGVVAVLTYLAKELLPLPSALSLWFFIGRGPLMVLAFAGFYPFLDRPTRSVSAAMGTLSGVIAGVLTMLFAVIQVTNLHDIRALISAASDPAAQQTFRDILRGVFTVQSGVNFVADFFLDLAAFLYAAAMWRHPRFGRVWALLSLALVGPHFVMKVWTFPVPPAEAGLFDAGPLVSVWFALVIIQVARGLRRRDPSTGTRS